MSCSSLVLLLVVGLSVQLKECSGQDEGACSYLYNSHPVSTMCPCSSLALLECTVGILPGSSVTIEWYWTQNQELAGIEGTQVVTMPGKYLLLEIIGTIPEDGLFPGTSELYITNFCNSDEGYYWCQMVIDSTTPLGPSFPRYLTVNTDLGQCQNNINMTEPKCVEAAADVESSSVIAQPAPSSVSQSGPQQTSMLPGIIPTSTAIPIPDSSAMAPGMGRGVLYCVMSAVVAVVSAAVIGHAVLM